VASDYKNQVNIIGNSTMIRVKCPQCEKTLGVDDAKAGKTVNCPECRTSITVPKGSAAKVATAKDKGAKPKYVRPGEEEDDFNPYTVNRDEAPRPPGEGEVIDAMVRHADTMRKRQKAWNKVGPAARMMKVLGFIICLIYILVFLYMLMTVVLYEHQLKLAANTKEHSNKLGPPKPLWPLNEMLATPSHGGISDPWYVALLFLGIMIFGLTYFGLMVAGAEKMKKLESYRMAMTGAILALAIPPLGAMAVIALRDEGVIHEFEETARQQRKSRLLGGD
jgi:ribosomal protein S27E